MDAVNLVLDRDTVKLIIDALRAENERLSQALKEEKEKSSQPKSRVMRGRGKVTDPQDRYYNALDVAEEFGTSAMKVFLELADLGIIKYDLNNKEEHHRPHQEFFEKGWFWRVERYSFSKKEIYFQTVFTSEGYRAVRKLLSERLTKHKESKE